MGPFRDRLVSKRSQMGSVEDWTVPGPLQSVLSRPSAGGHLPLAGLALAGGGGGGVADESFGR